MISLLRLYHVQEYLAHDSAFPYDPTVGLSKGPLDGRVGARLCYERGTPVHRLLENVPETNSWRLRLDLEVQGWFGLRATQDVHTTD